MLAPGLALLALGVAACGSSWRFVPASTVERATTRPGAGLVRRSGVTLVADPDGWPADPELADQGITAVHVRVLNDSDEPIAVRYRSFQLTSELGDARRPLPPLPMERERPSARATLPAVDALRFRFAPYYVDLVGDSTLCWPGGMELDPYYYGSYERWPTDLPSRAMVRAALPEGVLEPGGWLSGVLYFESMAPEARRVTLHVALDRPLGDQRVATVEVPFVGVRS